MKIPIRGTGCPNDKKKLCAGVWLLLALMCAAEPLSLDQAIEMALNNNPDVSAFQWESVAASAEEDAVRSQRLPEVKLRGSYSYGAEDQRLYPATYNGEQGTFGRGTFDGAVVLKVPLYTGGKIASEIAASELMRRASEGDLSRTREMVAFNVTSLFYSMLAQKKVVGSVESAVKAMEEQRRTIQEQVELQKAARVDVLRTDVRLAELREKRTKELNALVVQRWSLAALLGLEDGRCFELAGTLERTVPPDGPDSNHCMNIALQKRHDFSAVQQRADASAESVRAAKSAFLPMVSLESSYGLRWMSEVSEAAAGSDDSQDIGQIGVVAEWPLFSGGATRAKVRTQEARHQVAQQRQRQLRLQIRTEVETALANVSSAVERVETTETAVAQAQESFRIIQEKYELGKGAMVDVLTAQAALVSAETSYARARADLAISDARRKLAVGGILQ